MKFAQASGRLRSFTASLGLPLLLIALAATLATAVERFASKQGGLRVIRSSDGYGNDAIRVGSTKYPRVAVDSNGYTVSVARPSRRVGSQYWSLDEYLYTVVPPQRVVAVSETAYLERFSNVFAFTRRFRPAVSVDVESVLRLEPDLLLVANTSRAELSALVRSAGVPVYRAFTTFNTLEQIAETVRLTGYLTGEEETARKEIARFWDVIERARARKPRQSHSPRILGFGGNYSYGDQTLFNDVLKRLGAINVGAEGGLKGYDGLNSEQIVRWDPEWIVAAASREETKQVLARLLADPAIAETQAARHGRIVVFAHQIFLPLSPFVSLFATALSEAIYGPDVL